MSAMSKFAKMIILIYKNRLYGCYALKERLQCHDSTMIPQLIRIVLRHPSEINVFVTM